MNKYEHLAPDKTELNNWKKRRLASWRRSCGKKKKFTTEEYAIKVAGNLTKNNAEKGLPPVRHYYCKLCGKYHVTKRPLNNDK